MDRENVFNLLYDISQYAQKHWKWYGSQREVAWYLYEDMCAVVENGRDGIWDTISNLEEDAEDGSTEAQKFLDELYFYLG